jgi:serine/threonine protein kinase
MKFPFLYITEYGSGCDVSTDGDTYSYGMLLLEMFTGRRPTESFIDGVVNLVSFVKMAYPNNLVAVLDVTATYSTNTDTQAILDILVYPIFRIALACCNDSPRQRMKMHDVVEELNAIKMACAVQMSYS